ncbi:CACNA1B [Symbiodinium natans]|uniref:CACNA1B protein n=1 Tax=Symbiodinium natans TaxID=878477 RepID=A0A812L7P2_9DINO|nr:CACNA1B [Symbiodinium natans]
MAIYMDDRTMTSSADNMARKHQAWKDWSAETGLVESDNKAQFSASSVVKMRELVRYCPADRCHSDVVSLVLLRVVNAGVTMPRNINRLMTARERMAILGTIQRKMLA